MALEVAEPICIKVSDEVEGGDLARALRRRGLPARLARADACWEVTINSPQEALRTFLTDVGVALAAWMEEDTLARHVEDSTTMGAPPRRAL